MAGFNEEQMAQLSALLIPITDRLDRMENRITVIEDRVTDLVKNGRIS